MPARLWACFRGGVSSFLLNGGSFTPIDVPGSSGTNAFGINNAGQIVGSFTDVITVRGLGFLATPQPTVIPEPSTWLLLSTGLVGLLGYGWRRRPRAA